MCRVGHLLLGGVGQLILAAPVVALLDAWVGPQRLDRLDVLRLERRHRLVVDVADQLTVVLQRTHSPASQPKTAARPRLSGREWSNLWHTSGGVRSGNMLATQDLVTKIVIVPRRT